MTDTTAGRHRAPDPDVDPVAPTCGPCEDGECIHPAGGHPTHDPVTRAVEALRAFTGGDPLDLLTAWHLLASWAHLDTLTTDQRHEVVAIVTGDADQRTAVTR